MTIDFSSRVSEIIRSRKVHATQRLAALPDGGVRLTMTVSDLTEVGSWVLSYGDTARVLEPKELVERVTGEMHRALQAYGVVKAPTKPRGKKA